MAKEVAIGKRAKISQAQQNMIVAVIGASVVLGVAIALTVHFVRQIMFNATVIATEEKSIAAYSNTIKSIGVCKSPSGAVYSEDELKKCNPNSIEVSEVPGTLRAKILEDLAANEALNSVPKEASSSCIDPDTNKNYTYKKLNEIYNKANGADELAAASQLIKSCSALRVIPDALPAYKNEEALLASLNKLFLESGWQPESLSPSSASDTSSGAEIIPGLNALSVNLSVEADASVTKTVLDNIERSIREFDISKAAIKWEDNNNLSFQAQANAYYIDKTSFVESNVTITEESK